MANLAVLAGREIRESQQGVRNGVAYGAAWIIVDRLLEIQQAGLANVTEVSNAFRTVPRLLSEMQVAEEQRPIGALLELGNSARPGKIWMPQPGPEVSGLVHGHAALLSDEKDKNGNPMPRQVVRFVTVNVPQRGLVHLRISPKEGEGLFPRSPDELQDMIRAAYLRTVEEFPWWLEVSIGLKGPNFTGVTRTGQVAEGPRIPEQSSQEPAGLTGRALAEAFAAVYRNG